MGLIPAKCTGQSCQSGDPAFSSTFRRAISVSVPPEIQHLLLKSTHVPVVLSCSSQMEEFVGSIPAKFTGLVI